MNRIAPRKLLAFGLFALALGLGGCLTDDKDKETGGPTISTDPSDQSVEAGQNATFIVVASGSGSLTYQWTRDNVDIAGATAPVLVVVAGNSDDGAEYKCKVTDTEGSTTSHSAFLRIRVDEEDISLTTGGGALSFYALDLDGWRRYAGANASVNANVIDLVVAYDTTADSVALYSPGTAKADTAFTFMQTWISPNSTDIRIVSVANWNNVVTAADIKALYDASSNPTSSGRVVLKDGMTLVAKSNSDLYVLLRVDDVTHLAGGSVDLSGKAKW